MANQDSPPEQASMLTKTILIVEDDTDIGEFLMLTIQQETPHQAILATDGFQALKIIRSVKPNLFVLDYFLPAMNGMELYDHLHTTPGHEEVPTLFISANMPPVELENPHVYFLKKPFELEDFLNMIQKLLAE